MTVDSRLLTLQLLGLAERTGTALLELSTAPFETDEHTAYRMLRKQCASSTAYRLVQHAFSDLDILFPEAPPFDIPQPSQQEVMAYFEANLMPKIMALQTAQADQQTIIAQSIQLGKQTQRHFILPHIPKALSEWDSFIDKFRDRLDNLPELDPGRLSSANTKLELAKSVLEKSNDTPASAFVSREGATKIIASLQSIEQRFRWKQEGLSIAIGKLQQRDPNSQQLLKALRLNLSASALFGLYVHTVNFLAGDFRGVTEQLEVAIDNKAANDSNFDAMLDQAKAHGFTAKKLMDMSQQLAQPEQQPSTITAFLELAETQLNCAQTLLSEAEATLVTE